MYSWLSQVVLRKTGCIDAHIPHWNSATRSCQRGSEYQFTLTVIMMIKTRCCVIFSYQNILLWIIIIRNHLTSSTKDFTRCIPLVMTCDQKNMLHKDCSLCLHDGNKPWNNFLHHAEISITVIGIVNWLSLLRSPWTLQLHANLFSDYQAIEWVCARWKLAIINATRGLWTIAILDQFLFLIKIFILVFSSFVH